MDYGVIIIRGGKNKIETVPCERPTLDYDEVQNICGFRNIEILSCQNGLTIACDEDGRMKRLEVNPLASVLFEKDYVVGDVVLGYRDEDEEDDAFLHAMPQPHLTKILESMNRIGAALH